MTRVAWITYTDVYLNSPPPHCTASMSTPSRCSAASLLAILAGCGGSEVEVKAPAVQIEIGKDGKLVDVKSPLGDIQVGDGDRVVGVQSPLGDVEVGRDADGNTAVEVETPPQE